MHHVLYASGSVAVDTVVSSDDCTLVEQEQVNITYTALLQSNSFSVSILSSKTSQTKGRKSSTSLSGDNVLGATVRRITDAHESWVVFGGV